MTYEASTTVGPVGVIGLGAMGSAYSRRLMDSGLTVIGVDPSPAARERHREAGGEVADSPEQVAESCDVVITALPSFAACEAANLAIASRPRSQGWGGFDVSSMRGVYETLSGQRGSGPDPAA